MPAQLQADHKSFTETLAELQTIIGQCWSIVEDKAVWIGSTMTFWWVCQTTAEVEVLAMHWVQQLAIQQLMRLLCAASFMWKCSWLVYEEVIMLVTYSQLRKNMLHCTLEFHFLFVKHWPIEMDTISRKQDRGNTSHWTCLGIYTTDSDLTFSLLQWREIISLCINSLFHIRHMFWKSNYTQQICIYSHSLWKESNDWNECHLKLLEKTLLSPNLHPWFISLLSRYSLYTILPE